MNRLRWRSLEEFRRFRPARDLAAVLGVPAALAARFRSYRPRRGAAVCLGVLAAFTAGWAVHAEPAPPAAPRIVRAVPVPPQVKAAALTFDDGPNPKYTPQVLKLLAENGAHATFFVIGQEAARHPDLIREEAAAGNEVANHGNQHLVLRGRTPTAIDAEVRTTEQLLTDLTGTRPVLYRLPRGVQDKTATAELARLGYTVVMWSVDTRDYQRRTPQAITSQVLREIQPGSIVIFHDGGGNRQPTVDALATLLPRLKADGYQLLTVSQLLTLANTGG